MHKELREQSCEPELCASTLGKGGGQQIRISEQLTFRLTYVLMEARQKKEACFGEAEKEKSTRLEREKDGKEKGRLGLERKGMKVRPKKQEENKFTVDAAETVSIFGV